MYRMGKSVFYALACAYVPALLLLPLWEDQTGNLIVLPPLLISLLLFFMTAPAYVALVELGRLGLRLAERKPMHAWEKLLDGIALLLLLGILLMYLDSERFQTVGFCAASLMLVLWIVRAVICRKELHPRSVLGGKTFWITFLAVLLSVNGIFYLTQQRDRGIEEPPSEHTASAPLVPHNVLS